MRPGGFKVKNRKAILISGGWDSAACYFQLHDPNTYDLIFFSYGQLYVRNELSAAEDLSSFLKRRLYVLYLDLRHDQERRNFFFISEIKRLGYEEIVIGSRNLIPLFDKYRDSNWLSLKLYGWLMNIKVRLPITGWRKKKIILKVRSSYQGQIYNCYENRQDHLTCPCVNCREVRSIIDKS